MILPIQTSDNDGRASVVQAPDPVGMPNDGVLDGVVEKVANTFDVPVVTLNFIEGERQWVKAEHGADSQKLAGQAPFAGYTLQESGPFVVTDATRDERFAENPMVTGESHVRFYAGQPIRTPEGINIGTLSMIDFKPRVFSFGQRLKLAGIVAGIEQYLAEHGRMNQHKGLPSRPTFKTLVEEDSQAESAGTPVSLLQLWDAGSDADKAFVGLLLDGFAETAPRLCDALLKSVAEGVNQRTFRLANTLKHLGAQVERCDIQELCMQIEGQAMAARPVDQAVLADLKRAVEATRS